MGTDYGKEILKVKGERVWRTYLGGREIDRLQGLSQAEDGHFPEEWMYSVTKAANSGREELEEGLCRLDDDTGQTLLARIDMNPEEMLGRRHVKVWGNTPGVLIKLLDSQERLTIQVHPDKERAAALFNSQFGKTECWYILGTRTDCAEPPCLYLGFKPGITRAEWQECFDTQDYDRMLGLLHRIEVQPGEVYLVCGGVPHAIGAGCLILEIQEPTDYTIRVEKVTPSGFAVDDRMCHQGLGFDRMFDCFSYTGLTEAEVMDKYRIRRQGNDLINYQSTACFEIMEFEINDQMEWSTEGVFGCLYILSGSGELKTSRQQLRIHQHDQFFIPAQCGEMCINSEFESTIKILIMHGPKC